MVALDFCFGGNMQAHLLPITLNRCAVLPARPRCRSFRSSRGCLVGLAHLLGMDTTQLGLEPLIGVEELAEYLGVPVQTIYDWRLTGKAPRAFKLGKHLRFALSDVRAWLDAQREGDES